MYNFYISEAPILGSRMATAKGPQCYPNSIEPRVKKKKNMQRVIALIILQQISQFLQQK